MGQSHISLSHLHFRIPEVERNDFGNDDIFKTTIPFSVPDFLSSPLVRQVAYLGHSSCVAVLFTSRG